MTIFLLTFLLYCLVFFEWKRTCACCFYCFVYIWISIGIFSGHFCVQWFEVVKNGQHRHMNIAHRHMNIAHRTHEHCAQTHEHCAQTHEHCAQDTWTLRTDTWTLRTGHMSIAHRHMNIAHKTQNENKVWYHVKHTQSLKLHYFVMCVNLVL